MMRLCFLVVVCGIASTWSASIPERTYVRKTGDIDGKDGKNATDLLPNGFQQRAQTREFRKMARYIKKHLNLETLTDMDEVDLAPTTVKPRRAKRSIRRRPLSRRLKYFKQFCLIKMCRYSCSSFGSRLRRNVCHSCKISVCHSPFQTPLRDSK